MARFLIDRAIQAAIVLLLVSFAVYLLIGLMPGDPIDLMISGNPRLTTADAARLKALYGLDKPIVERYGIWLMNALGGDFGYSRLYAQPVFSVVLPRLANTGVLMAIVMVIALAVAVPLGVYGAVRRGSALDTGVNLLCFAGISMPPFFLAILLLIVFAVGLRALPAGGMAPLLGTGGWGERVPYLVMPVLTLVLLRIGTYTRFMRAEMVEALRQDYVRTARAKGAGEGRVVWRHALRNALTPLVTVVALDLGLLFSGALVTETMFGYLGMGRLIYDCVMGNDYNVAMVAFLAATAMILLGNFLADLAYAALDPRVTLTAARR